MLYQALDDNGVALAEDYVQLFDKNITTLMDSPKAYEDAVGLVLARDYLEAEKLEHAEKDYAQKKKTNQSWKDIYAAEKALNAARFERENSYAFLLGGNSSWKQFIKDTDAAQDQEINVKEAFPDYDQAHYFKNMDTLAQESFDKAKKIEKSDTSSIRNWLDRVLYRVTSSMPYIQGRTTDDFTSGKRAGQFANYLRSYKTSWNNWDPFNKKSLELGHEKIELLNKYESALATAEKMGDRSQQELVKARNTFLVKARKFNDKGLNGAIEDHYEAKNESKWDFAKKMLNRMNFSLLTVQ